MRKRWALAVAATTVTFLGGCGESVVPSGNPLIGAPTTSATAPMSPSDLPTLAAPTGPPTAPTDLVPSDVVVGRVTRLQDSCTEVTTDDAVVWSLSGDADAPLTVGDTVRVKVAKLEQGEMACGPGSPARIMSLVQVG